ncbi:hypothetical protein [Mycetocola zhujimingii]|uniref:Uncharacterized protein n=1 Tax=Mycetocola zhujimingii TaxID=2079792 RepID=A0A2U1TCN3_9MICO|nr:hypothetical protein [Mycetocola zhujimingii]PWC06649.1 hypothetical protein DF223_10310 [Mycetocola zhujimingii]
MLVSKHTVKPGNGQVLPRYHWWQLFSRSLFHLHLTDEGGTPETWSVDIRHAGDENGTVYAELYRDGVHHARSELPAAFAVPGGTIEVELSVFGLKRCHYVTPDGWEQQLVPDPASAEGLRAHLDRTYPVLSRAVGIASALILIVALVLGAPQIIELIAQVPPVAERLGAFSSPVQLPAWANVSLTVAAVAASTERALRLRYNRILDGGFFDGDD